MTTKSGTRTSTFGIIAALAIVALILVPRMGQQADQDPTIELKARWRPPGYYASISYSLPGMSCNRLTTGVPPLEGWSHWECRRRYKGGPVKFSATINDRGPGSTIECETKIDGQVAAHDTRPKRAQGKLTATCDVR